MLIKTEKDSGREVYVNVLGMNYAEKKPNGTWQLSFPDSHSIIVAERFGEELKDAVNILKIHYREKNR